MYWESLILKSAFHEVNKGKEKKIVNLTLMSGQFLLFSALLLIKRAGKTEMHVFIYAYSPEVLCVLKSNVLN